MRGVYLEYVTCGYKHFVSKYKQDIKPLNAINILQIRVWKVSRFFCLYGWGNENIQEYLGVTGMEYVW